MGRLDELSFIAYQEGDKFIAQCLQFDIAVQALSVPALEKEIERTLMGHTVVSEQLGIEPFFGLKPAPPVFWQAHQQAETHLENQKKPSYRTRSGLFSLPMQDLRITDSKFALA